MGSRTEARVFQLLASLYTRCCFETHERDESLECRSSVYLLSQALDPLKLTG